MPKSSPLNRAQAHNALRQIESELSPAVKNLANQLLVQLEVDGSASVETVYKALFPLAETVSAAAMLSTLVKKLQEAAKTRGLDLKLGYSGSKKGGVAGRRLFFSAPRATPVADTEGLDRIPEGQRITGQLATPLEQPRILLLTYNEHEFAAVRAEFWKSTTAPTTLGAGAEIVDDLGELSGWRILHGYSRQGNRESQRSAETFRRAHYPHAVVSVGIAFGMNGAKQVIGDVLVSKFIIDYELERVNPSGITLRGARPPASRALLTALEQLNIRSNKSAGWPKLHFGGLLSGEKLVDNLDYRDSLLALAGQDDIVGGEMEAAGLFTALDDTPTAWVVVKAICDFADGGVHTGNKQANQKHAAANAAYVVCALLSSKHYPCPKTQASSANASPSPNDDAQTRRAKLMFNGDDVLHRVPGQNANVVSLENIRETDERQNAPQVVAFDHLLQWLANKASPPLYALLGEYGMGKTTHCQVLTRHLQEQRDAGLPVPTPLYFDLRKVERIAAAPTAGLGHVATLEETIQDCLRNGYLHTNGQVPNYQDVLDAIDDGALVVFDGLDEVLSRITDAQGLRFTANLLKVLPEAKARQTAAGRASDARPLPKVLLSCRTQFFRNLAEQNSHLTGEHRGGRDSSQYEASVLQPFTDEQIRTYLQATLPGQDVDTLMALVADIHNLRELAGRPFTLKLVAQFVPRIQSWQQQGKTITGAALYREVAREWLLRDKEKQSFQPEQKEKLAGDLAAHLWRSSQRGLRAIELENWLDEWLAQLPPHASVLQKPRELLQQDLRNATFLKRTDADKPEDSRFEFAHTSLQEFFLADYLFRALQQTAAGTAGDPSLRTHWAMPKPSNETLDFLGQILAEAGTQSAELQVLSQWRKPYLASASELQLAYAVRAWQRGWPQPVTAGSDLQGADLSDWHFGTLTEPGVRLEKPGELQPLFDLSGCNFARAKLRRSRFWCVRLDSTDFAGAALTQAEILGSSCAGVTWAGADVDGLVIRPGVATTHPSAAQPSQWVTQPFAGNSAPYLATGHQGEVWSCAFSPNGEQMLSGGYDSKLKLWSVATGECVRSFTGHRGAVRSCAFSPDGQQVLAGADNGLKLWNVATGECVRSFTGHQDLVWSCAFSPNGEQMLSGGYDNSLKLWSVATGECLRSFTGHQDSIRSCAFSPNGEQVVSGSSDNSLKLWSVATGECVRSFTGQQGGVWSCSFSPNGEQVVSGTGDNSLKLWSVATGECVRSFTSQQGAVWSSAFSPDGEQVVSGSSDCLNLWSVATGECVRSFTGHRGAVRSCAFSPDGQQVLAGADNSLKLCNVATGECVRSFTGQQDSMLSCAFSPDGDQVVAGSTDKSLKLWRVTTGDCVRSFTGHLGAVLSCAFSPNGERVLSGSDDNSLKLWSVATGECVGSFTSHQGGVWSCSFSPNGEQMLSGSSDNSLKLWSVATGECVRTFTGHQSAVLSCAFSPDGEQVVSGSSDCLNLWSVATGECVRTLAGHQGVVWSCAFSPDGEQLVSGTSDNSLKMWSIATGECVRSFTGHQDSIRSCAFSPDGQQIFSCSLDSTLRMWDAQTGQCLQILFNVSHGAAAWDNTTNELLYASGRAWRCLRWQGHDAHGNTVLYPLESKPGVKLLPWTLD